MVVIVARVIFVSMAEKIDFAQGGKMGQLGKTPINVKKLEELLEFYPNTVDAHILLDGFTSGFKVNYEGLCCSYDSINLISAREHEQQLEEQNYREIREGRIAGPFCNKPFNNFRISPIGLVPKKDGGWRLIQHVSYPLGNSVNSYIDPDLSSVEYTSFDKVLNTISVIGPEDFELFGFKFKGLYFHDKCLPMGCSASCALFENNFFIFGMGYKREVCI
jgi:hypothetical protein